MYIATFLKNLLSNNFEHYFQKTHIIRDYLEDINEIPEPRKFWPRQIWSKYVGKLEVHTYHSQLLIYIYIYMWSCLLLNSM